MPTRHGGRPAKNASTVPLASFLRSTGRPCASAPCTWNQLLAKSRPMVVISATDGLPVVVVLTPGRLMPKAGTVHSIAEGLAGLRDRPHPGPTPRLTPEQGRK